jgi:hypothetical protein
VSATSPLRGKLAQIAAMGFLTVGTAALQLTYIEPGLLFLGPVLVLFAMLMGGLYPGERLLLRVTRPRVAKKWRRTQRIARPLSPRLAPPRGGALLAGSLAGRAPPL